MSFRSAMSFSFNFRGYRIRLLETGKNRYGAVKLPQSARCAGSCPSVSQLYAVYRSRSVSSALKKGEAIHLAWILNEEHAAHMLRKNRGGQSAVFVDEHKCEDVRQIHRAPSDLLVLCSGYHATSAGGLGKKSGVHSRCLPYCCRKNVRAKRKRLELAGTTIC